MIRILVVLLLLVLPAGARAEGGRADASVLYNSGTEALRRGDLGPAVAFLLAARRIDPRAGDVRRNLAIARARVDEGQGAGDHGGPHVPSALLLSSAESWTLAAALSLLGVALLGAVALRTRGRGLALAGVAVFGAGALLSLMLALRAREEARHPEAVVVSAVLEVAPAPEERPLSPYLLAGGDEVRLGRVRGDLVEVRVGGNSIGWARRSGLWRVSDAARYTAGSGPR